MYPWGRSRVRPLWRSHLSSPADMNWSIMIWRRRMMMMMIMIVMMVIMMMMVRVMMMF